MGGGSVLDKSAVPVCSVALGCSVEVEGFTSGSSEPTSFADFVAIALIRIMLKCALL